jgi:hypothetical protein
MEEARLRLGEIPHRSFEREPFRRPMSAESIVRE